MSSTGLHPVMAEVMARHFGMTVTGAAPQAHYPEVGRRRPYRSLGDAMAYEAGYRAFDPGKPAPTLRTPFADGWADAAADAKGEQQ